MTIKDLFAPTAKGLGGAIARRAAMTLAAVMLTATTAWAQNPEVSYIDENGVTQTTTNYYALTGSETPDGDGKVVLNQDVIVVNSNVTYDQKGLFVTSSGNEIKLILCDGKTLTINSISSGYRQVVVNKNLTIYGQTNNSGKLVVNATNQTAIQAGDMNNHVTVTVNGGTVESTSTYSYGRGLYCSALVFNGGNLKLEGNAGVFCSNENNSSRTVTLNWRSASDRVYISSFFYVNTVNIGGAGGKCFTDGNGNYYGGTYTSGFSAFAGKELQPATAYTLTLPDGVSTSTTAAFTYSGVDYYAPGSNVTLSDLPTDDPGAGYRYAYIYGGNTSNGTTLTMPNANVTVNVAIVPIDWATVNAGTEGDPYMIYNKDQLLLLAHRVNGTHGETANTYQGNYFKLGANIAFSYEPNEGDNYTENYEAIGHQGQYSGFYFKGNFDGDDKTVSGIRLRKTGTGTAYNCQGLFGLIGEGADIHDVHVTDARIKGYQNVGGIVGKDESGIVSNCTVTESAITANSNYGTICGWGKATLSHNYYRHCTVNGTAVTSGKGSHGADVTASNGAVPLYLVTPETGVTIQTVMADDLGYRYDSNNDGTPENYWRAGAELTLATTGIATPAQGYRYAYIYGGNTISGSTLTVANQDDNVSAVIRSDGQTYSVAYVNADGTTDDAQAIALDETMTTLSSGWYFVGKDINYTQTVTLEGDVSLILCNGKTMNVNTADNAMGINGNSNSKDLTIYGQTAQGGTLSVTADGEGIWCQNITINSGTVNVTASRYRTVCVDVLVTINGGVVTATNTNSSLYAICSSQSSQNGGVSINGGQVTATGNGGNIHAHYISIGYTNASDFITFNSLTTTTNGFVKIADGKAMTDGTNTYNDQTESATLAALTNKTLRPVTYTVSFNITNDDNDPASQTILHGSKATEPTVATRTGYTFSGWKNGETAYDFNSAVTSNLTLTASWIAHTYTVTFDKNAEDATGTMDQMQLTYDDWVTLGNSFSRPGYAFKEWNTKADGTGTSYSSETWERNLTDEDNGIVVLYAQWVIATDIATCKATVPDQTLDDAVYIFYKFENANYGYATIGEEVKDGNKVLTLGTDYEFGSVTYPDGSSGTKNNNNVPGEKLLVEIKGKGAYSGSLWAPFSITVADDGGTWGQLNWAFHAGTLTISGTGAMNFASDYSGYAWFNVAKYVKTITIGEGITTIADEAFAGTSQVNFYSNVQTVSLPSTLESIGANAFAYCTSLTINIPSGVAIDAKAFNRVGCVVASLQDAGDNKNIIGIMAEAISANVTLQGRTLYKDGNWNTLCLPFDMTAEQVTAQLAPSALMTLSTSAFENGTLTLNFATATTIEAGKPYIIKWTSGDNLVDPVFTGITVSSATANVKTDYVYFIGTTSPTVIYEDGTEKHNLYLGDTNTLYYPTTEFQVNAFRAYFQLGNGLTAGDPSATVKEFRLNFGNDTETGIINYPLSIVNSSEYPWRQEGCDKIGVP